MKEYDVERGFGSIGKMKDAINEEEKMDIIRPAKMVVE